MSPSAEVRPRSEESDMQLTTSQKHQSTTSAYAAEARVSGFDRCETIAPAYRPAASVPTGTALSPRGLVGGLGSGLNVDFLARGRVLANSQMSEDRDMRI
jgi:hypothetical protein